MDQLIIAQRPKGWMLWVARIGFVLAIGLLMNPLLILLDLSQGQLDYAILPLSISLFITCGVGALYKRVALFDKQRKTLTISHKLLFEFFKKSYAFSELSGIFVKVQAATTQGADISRQANTSFSSMLYLVVADVKRTTKGRKNITLRKCFDKQEAEHFAQQAMLFLME